MIFIRLQFLRLINALYYKNLLISNFIIDENDNIEYKVVKENINDEILVLLQNDFTCSLNEFPFIKSRIDNMIKFNLDELNYENNNYLIKLIKGALDE